MTFGEAGPEIDTSTSNAEEIARLFPAARVVKAFNTVFAGHQIDPIAEGVTLDAFVAGDDPVARATVMELAASIGLDPVDAGPLARARQLEGLAFLNIYLNVVNGGSWQSGWKLVGAPKLAPVAA
jgi:predicted dinucleotide-binding enzyme